MFSDNIAAQIAAAAADARIPEARMLAIVEVETGGNPFEADGRTPNFLFERHILHRELAARQPGKVREAERLGPANPKWGQGHAILRRAQRDRHTDISTKCIKKIARPLNLKR
jgi:hypothetical protein